MSDLNSSEDYTETDGEAVLNGHILSESSEGVNKSQLNKTVNFASINACGIKSKLKFPDFYDFINGYDILGINETKLDEYDSIEIEGYEVFCLHRKCKKSRLSGGVASLVKKGICKYVEVLKGSSLDV